MTGSDNTADWDICHAIFSGEGSTITVRLEVLNGSKDNLFSFDANGGNKKYFGIKPTHWGFFDKNSVFGGDYAVNDGQTNDRTIRRWDLDGNFIENLAGAGNHNAISPNKLMYAADNWYGANPAQLYLYRMNNTTPVATLMSHSNTGMVWTNEIHINPSFSRDGTKLFYNKATSSTMNEAWVVDISSLLQTPSINNRYDSYTTGANLTVYGYTQSEPTGTDVSVAEFPSSTNKSIKLYDNSTSSPAVVAKNFTAESKQFAVEYDFYGTGNTSRCFVYSGTTAAIELYEFTNVLKYRNPSGVDVTICPISANTWYDIKIYGNLTTDNFDIVVNGSLKASGCQFRNVVSSVDKIEFGTSITGSGYSLYVDNLIVTRAGNGSGLRIVEENDPNVKSHINSLYPNPTHGLVTVDANEEIESIQLSNTLGKFVLGFDNINTKSTVLDVSHLQKGLYVVYLQTITGTKTTSKLIIN